MTTIKVSANLSNATSIHFNSFLLLWWRSINWVPRWPTSCEFMSYLRFLIPAHTYVFDFIKRTKFIPRYRKNLHSATFCSKIFKLIEFICICPILHFYWSSFSQIAGWLTGIRFIYLFVVLVIHDPWWKNYQLEERIDDISIYILVRVKKKSLPFFN